MAVVKRMVVPPGKTKAEQEEYFDTDIGRVVPKPADPEPAAEPAAEAAPVRSRRGRPAA